MNKVFNLVCLTLISIVTLVACPTTPSVPPPVKATFNGVRKIDAATGIAQVSVSALDKDNVLLPSGKITEPAVTIKTTISASGLRTQATYQATPKVCGDLASTGGGLTAILTLDGSFSMATTDPEKLRGQAAKSFVDRMGSTDRAAVGSFSNSVILPAQTDLTSDKTKLKTAIEAATYTASGTNLWGAAFESTNFIAKTTSSNKVAIIFTDGEDNGRAYTTTQVISRRVSKSTWSGLAARQVQAK
jgi:von Willebrand factor type A domain